MVILLPHVFKCTLFVYTHLAVVIYNDDMSSAYISLYQLYGLLQY